MFMARPKQARRYAPQPLPALPWAKHAGGALAQVVTDAYQDLLQPKPHHDDELPSCMMAALAEKRADRRAKGSSSAAKPPRSARREFLSGVA